MVFIKNQIRKLQRIALFAVGGFRWAEKQIVGDVDQWVCNPRILDHNSIIVSGGVGHNISFEHKILEGTNCRIFLFDPSPTGQKTMRLVENQSDRILFQPIGLAGRNGTINFENPDNFQEGSFKKGSGDSAHQFICRSISSLASEQGWPRIDLLKIDIEGFEYEVLNDVLKAGLKINQICVEFHTRKMIGISESTFDIVRMVICLRRNGFHLVSIRSADFTFFHRRILGE